MSTAQDQEHAQLRAYAEAVRVLNQPGKLDDAEWELMRGHPAVVAARSSAAMPGRKT